MILACDVGGTKTDLALFERVGDTLRLFKREIFPSRNHESLDEIVAAFVGSNPPRLEAAGFGVAGPVRDGRVKTTNLPWIVEGARLAQILGLKRVSLLNDVEAQAWSLLHLDPGEQVVLQAGTSDSGNVAVFAPGTGLGCSALVLGGETIRSLASEGGHANFAPANELEIELWRFLRAKYPHVSAEIVISGPGLFHVYEFLREKDPSSQPEWLARELQTGDPTATVVAAALQGKSELAERAVLLFLGAFGSEAGNWALRTLSTGGIWLGGGVAKRILFGPRGTSDQWRARATAAFVAPFRDKGRLSPLLEIMPVWVIVGEAGPLLGAAYYALAQTGG